MGERNHCGEEQAKSQYLPVSRHSGPRWKKLKSLRDTSFRPAVKAILQSIIMRESRDDGWSRTGRLQIATDAGICLRQAGRYLPKLQRCGLVEIKRRYNAEPFRRVILEKLELAESSPLALHEKDILPLSRPKIEKAIHTERKGNLGTSEKDIDAERKGHLQHTKTVPKTVYEDCSEDCGAFGAARSPSVAQLGAAPSGSLGEKKEKPSLQEGNGFSFDGRYLKLTPEEERQFEELIPSPWDRTIAFTIVDESLRKAPADPVAAVQAWIKNQQAVETQGRTESERLDQMTPWRPKKPCASPGCPKLTDKRFCVAHAQQQPKTTARGYGWQWQKRSRFYLAEHPLCVDCEKEGRTTAATEVDHIIPRCAGGNDTRENLAGLCKSHHSQKTRRGL